MVAESFILFDNDFSGSIPTGIGNMDLRELRAHGNDFVGNIPDTLYSNVNLEVVRLDNNQLRGSLSNMIGNLDDLIELRLGNNTLTGGLPFTFYALSKLSKYKKKKQRNADCIWSFWFAALTLAYMTILQIFWI
jgi:hypothetical protein